MKKALLLITVICSCSFGRLSAQKPDMVRDYIARYRDLAIAEMKRTGIPAAITLAQGIHESGAGNSELALASNNHFGIKCKNNWTGETVRHDDDARGECFRKYPSVEDSYRDHSDFLKNGARYASLFSLDPTDYAAWANGLKKAGYATNPRYPQVLIKLVEDYQLQEYTLAGLGRTEKPVEWTVAEKSDTLAANDAVPSKPQGGIVSPVIEKPAFPEGEFRINDTRVVFVRKGTSFLSIALQYKTELSRIYEFNEIKQAIPETTQDQLVFLQRKRKTGDADFHIVQPGEDLLSIAQRHGIRLESLRELNWLKENEAPAAGEKLWLRSRSPHTPKLALRENLSLSNGLPTTTH